MMNPNSKSHPYPMDVDLSNCDNEPIHLIPYIQHHACLIACELSNLRIIHVSENIEEKLGIPSVSTIGQPLQFCLDIATFNIIKAALEEDKDFRSINPLRVGYEVNDAYFPYNLIVHKHEERLILEFEPYDTTVSSFNYQYTLSKAIRKIQEVKVLDKLYTIAAEEIRALTDYDRVMVYRFDDEGNGQVIAESKVDTVTPFLGLHYPSTDIPKQARALFIKNKIRLTSDVQSDPVSVYPELDKEQRKPLDLTFAVSRGVSPVHLEYLTNMSVSGTMSIAIENNGMLWGLFACHHYSPKFVNYDLRTTCEFLGQIFSGHLSLHAANEYRESVLKINLIKSKLFDQMGADWNIIDGLVQQNTTILDLIDCTGACVLSDGKLVQLGRTPNKEQILTLASWLDEYCNTPHFETDALSKFIPEAADYKDTAAGILAIRIMPELSNYIIWFRAEVIQEVSWGGNPNKPILEKEEGKRLSPRKSFEKWQELVKGTSIPWSKYEIEGVLALRNDIKDFIYKKYKEVQATNDELTKAYQELESFSYSVSHDLRAPLRNIKGFAQILMEDYFNQLDDDGKDVVNTIMNSTAQMNSLINDILTLSEIGRQKDVYQEINIRELAESIFNEITALDRYKGKINAVLKIQDDLPNVQAYPILFKQMLFNLISNAVKYSALTESPLIEIGGHREGDNVHISVKDNGIGFEMKHKEEMFNVFTRLTNDSRFSGNGVGLAIVKRIIDKHKGTIDVDSMLGEGTTFLITLPVNINT